MTLFSDNTNGECPMHGPVQGFLSAPVYAGEPRDPQGTGNRWCPSCGLLCAPVSRKEAP